jgi:hypothetical protein
MDIIQVSGTWGLGSIPGEGIVASVGTLRGIRGGSSGIFI